MKIKILKIDNWRSIKSIEANLSSLTTFLGKNNNGKSNILTAILFFFGEIGKISKQDYNDSEQDIVVEITFHELDIHDKQQFKKYLTAEGEIVVRKTAYVSGEIDYRGYLEQPTDEKLREDNISNYSTREKAAELPFYNSLPPNGRLTFAVIKQHLEEYIQNNKTQLTFERSLETNSFMGVRSIAQGLFGEILHVPPISSAPDELNTKGNTAFNKLYLKLADQVTSKSPAYVEAQNAIHKLIKSLNRNNDDGSINNDRPEGLIKLESIVADHLHSWKASLHVEFDLNNVDDALKLNTTVLVDDGAKTDISRKGNGLQRSLIFALIKSWAKLLKEERIKNEELQAAADESFRRGASNSHFFIFEEPELFLHPHAQRELFASLKELSLDNNQVFITTHSSSFLKLEDYKSIVSVCKNNLEEGTSIIQCNEELFDTFPKKKVFDLNQWLCPNRSEIFFATKVLLVEGTTDEVVLPYLSKCLNIHRHDYSIINCGGKESMPGYIKLLNCFKIKYTAIFDKDHQLGKLASDIQRADEASQRIIDTIDQSWGNYIMFDNDIEEELGITDKKNGKKPLYALNFIEDDNFFLTPYLEEKIRFIYSDVVNEFFSLQDIYTLFSFEEPA